MLTLLLAMSMCSLELEPATVEKAPTPDIVKFDAPAEVPESSDDARVKRFIGAFTGGVVGFGATMALMPLLGGCAGVCVGPFQVILGGLAPLLAAGGAWLGFELMGGDGGLMTPVFAVGPALLMSLGLLAISNEAGANSVIQLMPYLISAGVFLAGGAALVLDARARQFENLGAAASWGKATPGRVGLTVLVSTLTGLAAVVASGALFIAGSYGPAGIAMMLSSAVVGAFGATAAAWGVHRRMNGRGSLLAALGGMGLAIAVSGAGLGLFAVATGGTSAFFSPLRGPAALTLVASLAAGSAMFFPMMALEWSHTNAVEASLPKMSFGVAPTPNGGMVAAAMRF